MKKQFGQFVPVAGIAFGAISNSALVDKIAVAANDAYRERWLIMKSLVSSNRRYEPKPLSMVTDSPYNKN